MKGFSARGPSHGNAGYVLKPDITAPGDYVLAATVPQYNSYELLSGTSMSAPHIAGIAALLRQKYPNWSPMAIKSAIMTTAYQTTQYGTPVGQVFGGPFDFGAGHVNPNAALNPGLVFDSNATDWQRLLCGMRDEFPALAGLYGTDHACGVCNKRPQLCDPLNFNSPSITMPPQALGKNGAVKVQRRLTSVLSKTTSFKVAVTLPAKAGYIVKVEPEKFTLKPGGTEVVSIKIIQINLKPRPATPTGPTFGAITWTSSPGGIKTRIPVALP